MPPEPPQPPASSPADLSPDALAPRLRTRAIGRRILTFASCGSTNAVARGLVESRSDPPPHGTVVLSDTQSAGRGRNARRWDAPRGKAILCTVIVRPAPGNRPQIATMAAALAVIRAAETNGAAGCLIKWPNDVLSPDARKVCGILTEHTKWADGTPALVVGIGANVNQTPDDFSANLRARAASLAQIAGHPIERAAFLCDVLESFEACLALDHDTLFNSWHRHSSTLGRTVRVQMHGRTIVGHALGVEADGGLVVRLPNGIEEVVRSGDVEELRIAE